jgi:hypothetical protein
MRLFFASLGLALGILTAGPALAQYQPVLPMCGDPPAPCSAANPLPVDASSGGTSDVNLTEVAGAAVKTGAGTAAGSIRVELPTDGTGKVGLNAGSAIIGSVAIDQTTPGTTNAVRTTNWPTTVDTNSGNKSASTPRFVIATDQPNLTTPLNINTAQVNGVTTSTGAGAVGTGSQRVSVGQDTTTIAGSAPGTAGTPSTNVVTVQGASSMTPVQTTSVVGTTGGATASFLQPAASDNHATIKNGAGTLYGAVMFNNSVTINYLRYYNAGTGFNGCNSATNLIAQFQVLPSGGAAIQVPVGIAFSTGLSICVTSGYATTDTTNATASAMSITTLYN